MNVMIRGVKIGGWRNLSRVGVALCLTAISKIATAALILSDLSNGYSNCSWIDQGDGTSSISVTISYKAINGHLAGWSFISRGLLISSYDKNGVAGPSVNFIDKSNVIMEGRAANAVFSVSSYSMYYGGWGQRDAFSTKAVIRISNDKLTDWPAVAVRAGNYTNGDDVAEITGAAYIARGDRDGICRVIKDPTTPPPMPIAMTMSAPDWNLGELPEGNGEKIFPNSSDQLCFTYSGAAVSGKQFVINAGSANGVVNNRYRLKNLKDATQLIPYSLTLDSGASNVSLPNASNKALSLNSSGRTCFVPTFKTTVDPNVKSGDYSDVLTFTVVTKS